MNSLYSICIHNTESLESQDLGFMPRHIVEETACRLRRVLNPGHIVEVVVTKDDCLYNEGE